MKTFLYSKNSCYYLLVPTLCHAWHFLVLAPVHELPHFITGLGLREGEHVASHQAVSSWLAPSVNVVSQLN